MIPLPELEELTECLYAAKKWKAREEKVKKRNPQAASGPRNILKFI